MEPAKSLEKMGEGGGGRVSVWLVARIKESVVDTHHLRIRIFGKSRGERESKRVNLDRSAKWIRRSSCNAHHHL